MAVDDEHDLIRTYHVQNRDLIESCLIVDEIVPYVFTLVIVSASRVALSVCREVCIGVDFSSV